MVDRTPLTAQAKGRVLLTTHKVIIDAHDEKHARWLEEALHNDGYLVHREVCRTVSRGGQITQETERG